MNIQYSANLEDLLDVGSLMAELHDVVNETAEIKVGTLRTAAIPISKYLIADCDPENAYIHVAISFKSRDEAMLRRVGEAAFNMLEEFLAPFYGMVPLEYSVELNQMNAWTKGNIREKVRREARRVRRLA